MKLLIASLLGVLLGGFIMTSAKPQYPVEWNAWSEAAVKPYGGNPKLLIAIACHECNYGKSKRAIKQNNLHGITCSTGDGFRTFESGADSFGNCAYLLYASSYYEEARTADGIDLDKLGEVYCPKDPHWAAGVKSILRGL